MSLINDALRRAKAARPQPAPPPTQEPHFRPVEPEQRLRHATGLLVPVSFGVAALLALLAVWFWLQQRHSDLVARAKIPEQTVRQAPAPQPPSVPANPAAVETKVAMTAPAKVAQTSATVATPPPASSPATAGTPAQPSPSLAATNLSSPTETTNATTPAAPQPPPLKLKGIVYNQGKSSAVINGRVLFIGDRIGECRVTAISQESVMLVGGGKTNILSLEE